MPEIAHPSLVSLSEGSFSTLEFVPETARYEDEVEQSPLASPLALPPVRENPMRVEQRHAVETSASTGWEMRSDTFVVDRMKVLMGWTPPPSRYTLLRNWASPPSRYTLLRNWEGYVEEVREDSFIARLIDLNDQGQQDQEAEIYRSEVTDDDQPLLEPGAVFYWMLGYRDGPNGQRSRVSEVRFRRLPTQLDIDVRRARGKGQETVERLRWHR